MKKPIGDKVYIDYPDKFAKKSDWWRTEQGLTLIRSWRAEGKTIKEVYESMGIDPRTFRSWRKQYPEFDEVLNEGVQVANASVSQALLKRAVGYDYFEEVYELVEGELMLVRRIKKHMPPDVKAIMHWLYNRDPKNWRAIQTPIEETQYISTVQNILVTMKDVAEHGEAKEVEVSEVVSE